MTLDDNHLAVLRYVRDYSQKHPEIVPYIIAVTSEGIQAAMADERAIRADMETIAAVAVEKRFANRQEFIIGKLNKWRNNLMMNWDWFLGDAENEQDGEPKDE